MPILTPAQVQESLSTLPGWQVAGNEIIQSFRFADFVEAMRFVNAVAAAAEEAGHHPDIDIRYNTVRLALSSHDAGGITERDTALAAAISAKQG
jgi:4a-hydroxytetrahydrobiopterin dehydratase